MYTQYFHKRILRIGEELGVILANDRCSPPPCRPLQCSDVPWIPASHVCRGCHCASNTAVKIGVIVSVLDGLVEHCKDLLATYKCLQNERQKSKQGVLQSSINQLYYFSNPSYFTEKVWMRNAESLHKSPVNDEPLTKLRRQFTYQV
jgi:hypothetical protein